MLRFKKEKVNSQKQTGDCSSTVPTSCSVKNERKCLLDILQTYKLPQNLTEHSRLLKSHTLYN